MFRPPRMRCPAITALLLLVPIVLGGCASDPIRSQPRAASAIAPNIDSVESRGSRLSRVSIAARSDGRGHVVRLAFDEPVDAFNLVQSAPGLVQVIIYEPGARIAPDLGRDPQAPLLGVEAVAIAQGIGLDLRLDPGQSLRASVYADRNGRDVLVGLESVDPGRLELLTDGVPTLDWDALSATAGSAGDATAQGPIPLPSGEGDADYRGLRDNMKFDVVVIDAGHGGIDPGSIGVGGVREKDINLSVALKVGAYLEQNVPGLEVVYTRDRDIFVELEERGSIANRARGDLFVSIHCNAISSPRANGAEFYFLGLARTESALEVMKTENSVIRFEPPGAKAELSEEEILIYELANAGNLLISQQVAERFDGQFTDRARRPSRGVKQAGFVVLYHASMPAILVELGFLSNPAEARYLSSQYGQDILASAIYRAIRDYKLQRDEAFEASAGLIRSGDEAR